MHALHLLLRAFSCGPPFMAGKLFLRREVKNCGKGQTETGLLFRFVLIKAFQFEALLTQWRA